MKKNIAIITLAFVLGLLCCDLVSAQINPGLLRDLATSPFKPNQRERDLIRNLNVGPVSQDTLNLPPGFTMRPVDPPQNPLPRPTLPPHLFPTPQPPQPQPLPQPQPQGPTLQFGPGGPSVSFGNGPTINIPVGQIGQRLRNRGVYSPPRVLGYGPGGQVHTGDATVHGSTFAPGRNLSQFNGTQQQVQQPIYDQFGNLTGYQTGTTWRNSITGQQHGNMTRYTPNGTGGMHQSTTMYSTAGGNITPRGN